MAGALSEFQQTPYRSMQVSNIKEIPDAESTQVPMVISTVKMKGRPVMGCYIFNLAYNVPVQLKLLKHCMLTIRGVSIIYHTLY